MTASETVASGAPSEPKTVRRPVSKSVATIHSCGCVGHCGSSPSGPCTRRAIGSSEPRPIGSMADRAAAGVTRCGRRAVAASSRRRADRAPARARRQRSGSVVVVVDRGIAGSLRAALMAGERSRCRRRAPMKLPRTEPALVPTMTSAEEPSNPASSASALSAPMVHAAPSTPPAPRTMPRRGSATNEPGRAACGELPGEERHDIDGHTGTGHLSM